VSFKILEINLKKFERLASAIWWGNGSKREYLSLGAPWQLSYVKETIEINLVN